MSLNTSHANNGVLLHFGETIILFCDNVHMEFSGQDGPAFKKKKTGRLYLTTHRMIFNNSDTKDPLLSFSFPFVTLRNIELEQPIFGANYIKGKVIAQPNGNFNGDAGFKLHFRSGGAIEFGQAMLHVAQMASSNYAQNVPPPYTPPGSAWYAAPPPAYHADPRGYQGWVPPTNVFPQQPPANTVYMTDAPPPYPGINGMNGYAMGGYSSSKEAEASAPPPQPGYYDPSNPQSAYVPPPYYDEKPPSYDDANKKTK
uniref:WW domainbinding protein 2like [Megachile rotundata] n=1 Tax=Lepeophtheirus salmonis TaxID=72036 RepID=A0A0K2T0T4_LEPSM